MAKRGDTKPSNGKNDTSKVGAIPSLIASLAMIRAARRAPTFEQQEQAVRQRLVAATTVPKPEGRLPQILWRLDRLQRAHSWLGFPYGVIKKFGQDQSGSLAALVAYYGLFSIFPLMVAFISVIGFIFPKPEDQKRFAEAAADQIPIVGSTIRSNAGTLEGSTVVVVVGVLIALWSGLQIVYSMQNAMNNVWDVPVVNRPNAVMVRVRSLVMLLVIGGGLVASVVVSGLVAHLDFLPGGGKLGILAGGLLVSIGVYWLSFRLLINRKVPWSHLFPGAVFGGTAWWALQTWGNLYLSRQQGEAQERYGAFSQTILLMTFLYLLAQLSILGAEIADVKAHRLWPRSLTKGSYTDADIRAYELAAEGGKLDKGYDVLLVPAESVPLSTDAPASSDRSSTGSSVTKAR